MTKHRLPLTPADIELIMDALVAAQPDGSFPVGRQYKGKPTAKTQEHLAELYQTIGQAMGEKNIVLEFEEEGHDV